MGHHPDDSTWCGARDESSNTMKPYYLKNAGEYHSRLTTKLAVLLLALPFTGAFAAYDYTSVLDTTTTFSSNTVAGDKLSASNVTAAGTASDLNESNIGWSIAPTAQVDLEWTGSAVVTTSGSAGDLLVGGAVVTSSTASSSYNTLTIDDYVKLVAGDLTIGKGVLNASGDTTLVDATKLANSNAVTVTGAAYSTSMLSTTLTLGAITVGEYGNSNALSVLAGGTVTATGALNVGASDTKNPTYGSSNSVTISGKTSVDILSGTVTSKSSLTSVGVTIGNFGSSNTLTVSDSGILAVGGALAVGVNGSSNAVTVNAGTVSGATTVTLGDTGDDNTITASAKSAITASGAVLVGNMPAATGNGISLSDSAFTGAALTVGKWGSSNTLSLATSSTLTVSSLTVGLGDNEATTTTPAHTAADGTATIVASEGSSNTFSATSSKVVISGAVAVGVYGSSNAATFTGSVLASVAADADDPADGIQLDELTGGIASIDVGTGLASDATNDYSAMGSQNSLTFAGGSLFRVGTAATVAESNVSVGAIGSSNTFALSGASAGAIHGGLSIGDAGSSNAVTLSGASELTLATFNGATANSGALVFGNTGSSNTLTVEGGSKLTVTGNVANFGTGTATTDATAVKSAFGSSNVLTVDGAKSTLALDGTAAFIIGDNGSNNKLVASNGAVVTIKSSVTLGKSASANLGTILAPVRYFAEGNQIDISGGSSVTFSTAASVLSVGVAGKNNSVTVAGEDSLLDITTGEIVIGEGTADGTAYGSNNTVAVTDGAILIAKELYVGSKAANYGINNSLVVSSDSLVVVNAKLDINSKTGDGNALYIKNGMVAFLGKNYAPDMTWEQYLITGGSSAVKGVAATETSLVDEGVIKIWDYSTGAYVTAKASDLKLAYYSSEAEAEAATGYTGLAGYTVLTTAQNLDYLSWAGTLTAIPDSPAGNFWSSWYGYIYSNPMDPNMVFTYNDFQWQYSDPDNTPQDCYFYDYGLGSWIYTNETMMKDGRKYYQYSDNAEHNFTM